MGIAWRIETARLLLRPWARADARALKEAIDDSLEHLRAWLPWALHEPETVEQKEARIDRRLAEFEAGNAHVYGVFDATERRMLGCVGLEPVGGPAAGADPAHAREVGYWVRASAARHGITREAVSALTRVGFGAMALDHIEIQCDPRNRASAAIPRRLGYALVETRVANKRAPDGRLRDSEVWVLDRAGFRASPCGAAPLRAFGRTGDALDVTGVEQG